MWFHKNTSLPLGKGLWGDPCSHFTQRRHRGSIATWSFKRRYDDALVLEMWFAYVDSCCHKTCWTKLLKSHFSLSFCHLHNSNLQVSTCWQAIKDAAGPHWTANRSGQRVSLGQSLTSETFWILVDEFATWRVQVLGEIMFRLHFHIQTGLSHRQWNPMDNTLTFNNDINIVKKS